MSGGTSIDAAPTSSPSATVKLPSHSGKGGSASGGPMYANTSPCRSKAL